MIKPKAPIIPPVWLVQPTNGSQTKDSTTLDNRSLVSHYPHRSLYKAEILINGHLKKHWNTCWSKVVAVNELFIGLLTLIIGILIVSFELTFAWTAHGIWTGCVTFIAGLFAFLTIIYRRHHFFLLVASIHILAGLISTIMIFISIFALALQINSNANNYNINDNTRQLDYGLHGTLIVFGLYEKLLCYTLLIMIIRHTRKMV